MFQISSCIWNLGKRFHFFVPTLNIKYNLSYSSNLHPRKRQLRTFFYISGDDHCSQFWRAEMQLYHNAPFRTTYYVLISFGILEVSNLVSNWNKGKTLIFVKSVFQIRQFEILELIYLFVFHSSIWISFSYIGSLNLIV